MLTEIHNNMLQTDVLFVCVLKKIQGEFPKHIYNNVQYRCTLSQFFTFIIFGNNKEIFLYDFSCIYTFCIKS